MLPNELATPITGALIRADEHRPFKETHVELLRSGGEEAPARIGAHKSDLRKLQKKYCLQSGRILINHRCR